MKQKIQEIEISKLNLWTENPRDPIDNISTDEDIIDRIIEDSNNKWNIEKLIQKMGEYYDYSELPIVVKKNGRYIVFDGNRRIALLKILQDENKYTKYVGKLFKNLESKLLRDQNVLPCNVCDEETAINSIYRKHSDNGSWGELERDYFLFNFKKEKKTHFVALDEQTGFIKDNKILNKRFIKDEVLNEKNLKEINIEFKGGELFSKYSKDQLVKIFTSIQESLKKGSISTRQNRGKLKSVISKDPVIKDILNNPENINYSKILIPKKDANDFIPKLKKSPHTKKKDIIFGRILEFEDGPVNDLYLAIDRIYKSNKDNEEVLLIIGMSMRLILDVAARNYYRNKGNIVLSEQENPYLSFIKEFQKDCVQTEIVNYLSTTSDFLNKSLNLDALLGKYAHGNTQVSKQDVLKMSYVTADILEYFLKKKDN
jgi:hypothetical protein